MKLRSGRTINCNVMDVSTDDMEVDNEVPTVAPNAVSNGGRVQRLSPNRQTNQNVEVTVARDTAAANPPRIPHENPCRYPLRNRQTNQNGESQVNVAPIVAPIVARPRSTSKVAKSAMQVRRRRVRRHGVRRNKKPKRLPTAKCILKFIRQFLLQCEKNLKCYRKQLADIVNNVIQWPATNAGSH